MRPFCFFFFFFNDTATTEIYTLSLHDALPIFAWHVLLAPKGTPGAVVALLNDNLKRILLAPGQPKLYEDRGLDMIVSSPEECATYLKNEMSKWGKVIKERGMRAD